MANLEDGGRIYGLIKVLFQNYSEDTQKITKNPRSGLSVPLPTFETQTYVPLRPFFVSIICRHATVGIKLQEIMTHYMVGVVVYNSCCVYYFINHVCLVY